MTRRERLNRVLEPGQIVLIAYTGYTTRAVVLADPASGSYGPMPGWVKVREQASTSGSGTVWPDEGPAPEYEAAKEYVYLEGEERPPDPFSAAAFREALEDS